MTQNKPTDDCGFPAAISLSFDYQQESQLLCWSATDGHRNIYMQRGPMAGGVWLQPAEHVSVFVKGGGPVRSLDSRWSFKIIDCFIITIPELRWSRADHAKEYSAPSPFVGSGSTTRHVDNLQLVPEEQLSYDEASKEFYLTIVYRSLNAFQVIGKKGDKRIGRWDMSFILTVEIQEHPGDTPYVRVFRFDPETEVGNGHNKSKSESDDFPPSHPDSSSRQESGRE
ncbi:hypothetical protein ACQ859_18355 [Roseateles chitinivorans]|uniref:hypothetical protein n=1 Tax=Roseateles chitinivorans TaxID=2917965 RepID=UPI003D67027B